MGDAFDDFARGGTADGLGNEKLAAAGDGGQPSVEGRFEFRRRQQADFAQRQLDRPRRTGDADLLGIRHRLVVGQQRSTAGLTDQHVAEREARRRRPLDDPHMQPGSIIGLSSDQGAGVAVVRHSLPRRLGRRDR